jgi:hypothetical protein
MIDVIATSRKHGFRSEALWATVPTALRTMTNVYGMIDVIATSRKKGFRSEALGATVPIALWTGINVSISSGSSGEDAARVTVTL